MLTPQNFLSTVKARARAPLPPTWLLMSSFLLQTLKWYTLGAVYECAQRMIHTRMIADAYVVYKDLPITSNHADLGREEEAKRAMEEMEGCAQAWEWLLFASEGALAFEKCYWWLIGWNWENGQD